MSKRYTRQQEKNPRYVLGNTLRGFFSMATKLKQIFNETVIQSHMSQRHLRQVPWNQLQP